MEAHLILVLTILIAAYLFMGGLLFQKIEDRDDDSSRLIGRVNISQILQEILPPSMQFRGPVTTFPGPLMRTHPNFNQTDDDAKLLKYFNDFAERVAVLVIGQVTPRNKSVYGVAREGSGPQDSHLVISKETANWDFFGSLFFAATTITTIGYGDVVPETSFGKMATVVYALIGIPLVAAFLGGLSDRIRQIAERLQQRVPLDQLEQQTSKGDCCLCCIAVIRITFVFLVGASIFIGLPAWLFTIMESNWGYIEGLYFAFVTLSTIGFGDYIAARNPEIDGLHYYRIAVVVWIFVGLAWLSSVIGLIQAAITTYSAKAVKQYIHKDEAGEGTIIFRDDDESIQRRPSVASEKRVRRSSMSFPKVVGESGKPDRKGIHIVADLDTASNASLEDNVYYSSKVTKPTLPQPQMRRTSPYARPRSQASINRCNSMHGMVSVAAAASTTEGDRMTMVGILPQMLHMAMCANAATDNPDTPQLTRLSPRPWQDPNYMMSESCFESRPYDPSEAGHTLLRGQRGLSKSPMPRMAPDYIEYDIPPKHRTPGKSNRLSFTQKESARPQDVENPVSDLDDQLPFVSKGTLERMSKRPNAFLDDFDPASRCERQTNL